MFVIVCATLKPFADYVGVNITVAAFISLFVCLIPTTIGGLLSAIGIAGMDRALRANVITKSGKAVETAGDIDTLLLDKTGTITIGNRKATKFYPVNGVDAKEFLQLCVLSSAADETPEGKSIVELGREQGFRFSQTDLVGVHMVKFTAETKCSGVDMPDGRRIRKGASEAIRAIAEKAGNVFSPEVDKIVRKISENGGTPLVVSENERIKGVIELQDIIKTGIRERFERLRKMGVKTVMVTGDNPLTAKYIAEQAGVDDFIAEAKPEDKMEYIRREQQAGKLVAMMGDGTNDAPALAQADVGVAMNSGTQAAKEAGNMVDLDNDPTKADRDRRDRQAASHDARHADDLLDRQRRGQVFRHRPRPVHDVDSRAGGAQHHAPRFARKRHPVGGDLQRDHHSAAHSAGAARRGVQAHRSFRPCCAGTSSSTVWAASSLRSSASN